LQTEENVARKKSLVVLWCSYRQYYRRKANTTKSYGKIFTSEIDIQHVKLELYITFTKNALFFGILQKLQYFLEFKKTPPFTLNAAVIVLV